MQCPNCGKEALNVNGRFVCLDCGVEISQTGVQAGYQSPPSLINHDQKNGTNTPGGMSPVVTPATPNVEPRPVSDASGADVSYVPAVDDDPKTESQPKIEEPVRDYYLETLNKMTAGDFPASSEGTTTSGASIPDFPETVSEASPSPSPINSTQVSGDSLYVPPSVATSAPMIPENQNYPQNVSINEPTDMTPPNLVGPEVPQSASIDPLASAAPQLTPVTPASVQVPTPDAVSGNNSQPTPEPNNEFQLENNLPLRTVGGDIREDQGPTIIEPNPYALPVLTSVDTGTNPAEITFNSNTSQGTVGALESVPDAANQNKLTVQPPSPESNPGTSPVSDATSQSLGATSAPEPMTTGTAQPAVTSSTSEGFFPGSQNLPSAESVFGAQVGTGGSEIMEDSSKTKNKIIFIIIAAVLGIALFLGAIFVFSTLRGNESQISGAANPGKVLEISQSVAGKMDASVNALTNFNLTYDLSGLSVLAEEDTEEEGASVLKTYLENSHIVKGYWQVDTVGNLLAEMSRDEVASKRIYIKEEDKTYSYSNESESWVSAPGALFSGVPPFVPIENRGSVFYNSIIENIIESPSEIIDEKTYKKVRIFLKKDFFDEMILDLEPDIFAENLDILDTEGFVLTAYIDEESRVYKITGQGAISISSDNITGSISFDFEGEYEYSRSFEIKKP